MFGCQIIQTCWCLVWKNISHSPISQPCQAPTRVSVMKMANMGYICWISKFHYFWYKGLLPTILFRPHRPPLWVYMSKYWIYSVFWWKLLWQDQITGKWIMMLWPWWCWWCQWCQWWWRWRFWSGFQTGVLVETAHRGKRWLSSDPDIQTHISHSFFIRGGGGETQNSWPTNIWEIKIHREIQNITPRNPNHFTEKSKKIFPKMLNLRISLNPKKSANSIYLLSENHFFSFWK